jgi:hypothetical protein
VPATIATRWVQFFTHPKVKTAIAVYIFITGLVYFFLLRNLWDPKGLQLLADVVLHYVMPVLFGIEWLFLTAKGHLRWQDTLRWLVFPIAFAIWALLGGQCLGFIRTLLLMPLTWATLVCLSTFCGWRWGLLSLA